MSLSKKDIRKNFREAVFNRDGYRCRVCRLVPPKVDEIEDCDFWQLDAHHITNRNDMPNGGYVLENGISLCPECHMMAELTLTAISQGNSFQECWHPRYLYNLIGSSHEKAVKASERLR